MILAYLREASLESSSDFAPVTTIFPEAKISAVVLGSRIRMMTAAKRYAPAQYMQRTELHGKSIPLDCTLHFEHEEQWFSDPDGSQD